MDQITHLKKRMADQSTSSPPLKTYIMSPNPQKISQHTKYESQPMDNQQCQQQIHPSQSIQAAESIPATTQVIQYQYYDPPMTLNAWTQVNFNDSSTANTELSELKIRVKELEERLEQQSEQLEQYKKSADNKPELTTYRILAQANESHNGEQIEIEISDPSESCDGNISSSSLYQAKSNQQINSDHVYEIKKDEEFDPTLTSNSKMTTLGPRYTQVPTEDFEKISWSSASVATRKLLTTVFDRETLATHSMTGKASPAFKDMNKPVKCKLDPDAIQDIIYIVSKKCGVSAKEVRSAITTKCADENKMLKLKEMKAKHKKDVLRERN